MKDIPTLLDYLAKNSQCRVYPAQGLPQVDGHELPLEVVRFYSLCGGVDLFSKADYPYTIVLPGEFARANPVIIQNLWQE